jgi:hypothetical protein
MSAVIFEDAEIIVYSRQTPSNFVVVTFSDMGSNSASLPWAGAALEKIDVSYIAFVSKYPNWFPKTSVIAAYAEIIKATSSHKTVVTYGFSQGAYAALKYSGLLKAETILAFSPQYSIDPSSLGGADDRYRSYYTHHNIEHDITSADIAAKAKIFCFFDPSFWPDQPHMSFMGKLIIDQYIIKFFGFGHETIKPFSSSDNLRRLLDLAQTGNALGVRSLARTVKRHFPARRILFAITMPPRKIETAKRIIGTIKHISTEHVLSMVQVLAGSGEHEFLVDNIEKLCQHADERAKLGILNALVAAEKIDLVFDLYPRWLVENPDSQALRKFFKKLTDDLTIAPDSVRDSAPLKFFHGTGWHLQEGWGCWSRSKRARIILNCSGMSNRFKTINIPTRTTSKDRQKISARYSWGTQSGWGSKKGDYFIFPIEGVDAEYIFFDFHTDRLYSPFFLGRNSDQRSLGVGIAMVADWEFI